MIIHLRVVPGFGIAVEEREHSELRSCPVIMGGLPNERGVIQEVNFQAHNRGVRPGMTLSQAHQQCPEGIFLVPDLVRYQRVWEEICEILRMYTPLVGPFEIGQAACDLSGCERLWGDSEEAARAIVEAVREGTGISAWVGIASNRLVAQLASMQSGDDGITIVEAGRERQFLADLPVTLLPGVDSRLALTFQVLGLKTISQLAALPGRAVKRRFGAMGEKLHGYACGIDTRKVIPPPSRPSVSAELELQEGSPEEAMEVLRRLAEACATELQSRHLAGKLVGLILRWDSGQPSLIAGKTRERRRLEAPRTQSENDINSQVRTNEPAPIKVPRDPQLLIPQNRIHSVLPRPNGNQNQPFPSTRAAPQSHELPAASPQLENGNYQPAALSSYRATRSNTIVRTAIDTAPQLFEQAKKLLLQSWPEGEETQLQAMGLDVSEFEPPSQLSFGELLRLDQTGTLGGRVADPCKALASQDQLLRSRLGSVPFRHVTNLDPESILTERRFRWQDGLSWSQEQKTRRKALPKAS